MNRATLSTTDLDYQYSDSTRLRVRSETHRLYSEHPDTLRDVVIRQLALHTGQTLLDVGCGPGGYHADLRRAGVSVVGVDASAGMVREAQTHAARQHEEPAVLVVQADAQWLPFPDGVFDRLLAAHMLYHVPDQATALREYRRVLRPGGRIVIATNAAAYLERLETIHREAAVELGYEPTSGDGVRFTLDDWPLVQSVFPAAQRVVIDNALRFTEHEPVLRYYASGVIDRIQERPTDGSHRARLLSAVQARIEHIIRTEGCFRDPKPTGCFVADLPLNHP